VAASTRGGLAKCRVHGRLPGLSPGSGPGYFRLPQFCCGAFATRILQIQETLEVSALHNYDREPTLQGFILIVAKFLGLNPFQIEVLINANLFTTIGDISVRIQKRHFRLRRSRREGRPT
jgi:hypothetical protein